jgi:general secretion pathway protein F/type IV pilus assembly protein PilC
MADFTYVARDSSGQRITGSMSAASERDVVNVLSGRSLFPVSVEVAASTAPLAKLSWGKRVSGQKIAVFYEQLSSLIKNGVPLIRSLTILREQTSAPGLKNALDDVIQRVEEGETLGDSFARHPNAFSEVAVNMSRAGAEGGFLEEALERLARFTQEQDELKSRTIGALIYPAVLATAGTIIVCVLLIFFVPKFGEMFDTMRSKGDLPAVTDWLLAFSNFLRGWGWLLLLAMLGVFFAIRAQFRSDRGRLAADRLKLRIPLFGGIFRNLAVSRFCRVLGTLMHNGVPILRALEISSGATGNRVLAASITQATENITAGESLSVPLAKSGHFPRNVTEMISVAEESNTLDTVLVGIAENMEKQTTRRLDMMVKLLEPLMLLVMAAIILVIVIALLLPVMSMGSVFQN